MGNDQSCIVVGIGNIMIDFSYGTSRIIQGFKYVPSLKRNLISLGMLADEGYYSRDVVET